MSKPIPPQVLEKLRRCLALGQRSNWENEAATAMKIARTLMDEYGLSQADVEIDKSGHVKEEAMAEAEGYKCRDLWPWEKGLGFVCDALLPVKYFIRDGSIVFVGAASDAALAAEVYRILRKELLRLSLTENNPPDRRSFLMGCVKTLRERAKEMNTTKAAPSDTGRALVVVKANDVAKYVAQHYNFGRSRGRGSALYSGSFERGRQAGHGISLNFKGALS